MSKKSQIDPEQAAFDEEQLEAEKSKSEIKREFRALFDLGEKICDLSPKHLGTVPLTEDLLEIVDKIRRMPKREARRRELRYFAKQLREADTEAMQQALQALEQGRRDQAREFHRLEELRDAIVADLTTGVEQALNEFPTADRQLLTQLARNSQKELGQNKPPSSARKLFRYLRELHDAS